MASTLLGRLEAALDAPPSGLAGAAPVDGRDALGALLTIYDLSLAPLGRLGGRARWQHHPAVAALKQQLEVRLIAELDSLLDATPPSGERRGSGDDAAAVIRSMAAGGGVPGVYRWLAAEAAPAQVRRFIAAEGGPDGGFDDLVALCQLGLDGGPKMELAKNYWDEMGRGVPHRVHTQLFRAMNQALHLASPSRQDLGLEALRRQALPGLLATNRWLQPEMIGALGVIELQAGPRCRCVVKALGRVGADRGALPFYEEHAVADPRHGKDWLDGVVGPLAEDPDWAPGMIRGARWRVAVNDAFLSHLWQQLTAEEDSLAGAA
jgi:hypothetical protein